MSATAPKHKLDQLVAYYEDPLGKLDWRWGLAMENAKMRCDNIKNSVAHRASDCPYVRNAASFLYDLYRCKFPSDRMCLSSDYPDVSAACSLRNSPSRKRYYVEAMLLCHDQGLEDMAAYLGMDEMTLHTYERLFFNIREDTRYIEHAGYVVTEILSPALLANLEDAASNPDFAWKMIAIFGGFEVLRTCWEYRPHSDFANNFHRNAGMSALFRAFGVGSFTCKPTKYNHSAIAEAMMKLMDMEVKREGIAGLSNGARQQSEVIGDLLSSLRFSVADVVSKGPHSDIELSFTQRLAIAQRTVPTGQELVAK